MNKISKEELMDYLYEELSPERMEEIRVWLEGNPEARAELEELQDVRSTLQGYEDQPVERPVLMMPVEAPTHRKVYWWPLMVAATLLLLTVVLIGMRMEVRMGNGQFTLAFYESAPVDTVAPVPLLTREEVSMLVADQLANQIVPPVKSDPDSARRALETWKGQLLRQVVALQVAQAKEVAPERAVVNGVTQEELYATLRDLQEENLRLMMALLEDSNESLRQDFQETMVELSEYYTWQRTQDQSEWEVRMATLKQETEETQQKTDYLYNALVSNND